MRILYPVCIDSHGPIGTIYREVGKRLPHQITAFSKNKDIDVELGGISTISVGENMLSRVIDYIRTNLSASNFDLIHTGPIKQNIITIIGKMGSTTSHIHTIHNAEWGLDRGVYPFFYRRIMTSSSDQLTTVSPFVSSIAQQQSFLIKNPTVIPNGVDTRKFHPNLTPTNENLVLFIGRLCKRKNPEFILKLAKKHTDLVFAIRGEGPLKGKLINRAPNNVVFLDQLTEIELAKTFSKACVTLCPYRNEGFGMVAIESMAAGTPVIGLRSGNLPELITNSSGYLCSKLTLQEWSQKLEGMIQRVNEFDPRSRAERFDWDRIANEYDDIYRKMQN